MLKLSLRTGRGTYLKTSHLVGRYFRVGDLLFDINGLCNPFYEDERLF